MTDTMPLPVNIHLWIPRNKYPRNDQSQDAEEFPGGLAVKDLALSLLWLGFSLWPGNFGRLQAQPKKKKKTRMLSTRSLFWLPCSVWSSRAQTMWRHWLWNPLCQARDHSCVPGPQRRHRACWATAGTPEDVNVDTILPFTQTPAERLGCPSSVLSRRQTRITRWLRVLCRLRFRIQVLLCGSATLAPASLCATLGCDQWGSTSGFREEGGWANGGQQAGGCSGWLSSQQRSAQALQPLAKTAWTVTWESEYHCQLLRQPRRSEDQRVSSIFLFFFPFFGLFWAAPAAHGGSQARVRIGAIAAGLHHTHSNIGSEPHLRPTPQLTATLDP